MRIVFLGTGDIGLPSLEHLLTATSHEVVAVVTQPDKPVGRKQVLTPPAVKVRALEAGIPVLQPQRLRTPENVAALAEYQADVFVVVAYGQILSRQVLDLPRLACLNIHASILPRHRGASPIQAAIREGDAESGVTIMWMDEGLDTGPILLQDCFPLSADETGGSLHDRLAQLAPASLDKALALIEAGHAPKIPQDNSQSTHCKKLEREHGHLDWQRPAEELERLIRAYQPWPGTFARLPGGERPLQLKILKASLGDGFTPTDSDPSTVSEQGGRLWVTCGSGALELESVQLEGRKPMSAAEFLRGQRLDGIRLL
ncbi:methionyl-tRNA formyltransferase [Verrucomicrobium sp. BvORR034]|uniref:methionyl-tRNA formyltransferase n=1 Tax=Verrucomicrobium sp. BvORR034 TaxID=1396418 RepID=UPI000678FD51|nr:methionyl-tRNA formyltransferase [Verrucomicrobium sp. BvORR034]